MPFNKAKFLVIFPVHEKGSPTSVNNYRQIVLLSISNKLLESSMYNRLVAYLEKPNVFCENRFGFTSNHWPAQALILITDKIQKVIENGTYAFGIFLDLPKPFHMVNHLILQKMLTWSFGIRGIANERFVSYSYLCNRKQFLSIAGSTSNHKSFTYSTRVCSWSLAIYNQYEWHNNLFWLVEVPFICRRYQRLLLKQNPVIFGE